MDSIKRMIVDKLGSQEAGPIIQIIDEQLKLEQAVVPPLPEGKTYGDWSIFIPYTGEELRPAKALTYDTIEYMLSTGIIRFALDIKRAQTSSVMNNEKSIKMITPDPELAQLALRGYMRVAPQFIYEMTHSALAYGTAFFETPWITMSGYELGVSDSKSSQLVSVPEMPNLVPHRTVRAIRRKTDGTYNGFIQNIYPYFTHPLDARARDILMGQNDIIVEADASLVVPYNGISRNLWGESFLTPLYTLWFWYELIMRCLVRYSELMGDPIRLAKAPLKKKLVFSDTGKTVEAMDYMLNLAVGLSKSNAVVIPSDLDQETRMPLYDMSYLMTPDKSQPFVQILDMLSQYILQAAVAGTRQSVGEKYNADIGSNTVGNIALHNEMIVNSWVYYINKYFVSKFSTYNRGKGGPPVWMEVQGLDPKEREFMASMMGVAGNSSTFQEFFYQVDWKALGEAAGIPMLNDEQVAALKAKLAEQQPQEQPVNEAALELAKNPPLALTSQELSALEPIEIESPFSIAVAESIRDGFNEVAGKLESIKLANPYHDADGHFTSRAKADADDPEETIDNKRKPVDKRKIAATIAALHKKDDSYEKDYLALPDEWKEVVSTPEDYQKKNKLLGLAKMGANLAFSFTVGAAIYNQSAILGAAAAGAIATAMLGSAPAALVALGGITAGLAASNAASVMFDNAGNKVVNAFYKGMGDNNLSLQKSSVKDYAVGVAWKARPSAKDIVIRSVMGFTGMGLQNSALVEAGKLLLEDKELDDYDIATALLPMVTALRLGKVKRLSIPFEFPGFEPDGDVWTMTQPDKFIKLESIELANPYHDEKGRFSEAQKNKTGIVGFIKAHPKETALAATVAAVAIGVGVSALVKRTSPTSESVSGNAGGGDVKSKIIHPEGFSFSKEAHDKLNVASVAGAGVVRELGVKGSADISWHVSRFSFAREMAKDLGHDLTGQPNESKVVQDWVAKSTRLSYAFSGRDKRVHFGSQAYYEAINHRPIEFTGAVVAHEVFHSRDSSGGNAFKSRLNMTAEEMMASTVGSIAYSRIKNGVKGPLTRKDLTKDFWSSAKNLGKEGGVGYSAGYRKTLFRAAAYKMRATNALAKRAGLPVPYGHPVDVVSQWFNSESAHSDIHTWLSKSGGVPTPTGSYTFPGFKFLGTIQLEESIKLVGNPFHDIAGRFTSASLSVGLVNSYKDKIPAKLDPKMKVVVAKDWNQTKQLLGTSNQHILGAYHNHTLVLSPNVNKQNAERVVRHEAYHGRIRANGLTGVNTMNKHTVDLEEGTTELLTFRGFKGGDPSRSWYYPQMKNVASVARKASGGDNKKAWKFVDSLHYYNGSSQSVSAIAHHTGEKDVSKYLRGNNSGDDLQWLLSHPVNLEDFDQLFAESEQSIYNELRKIGAQEIELVTIPEELL